MNLKKLIYKLTDKEKYKKLKTSLLLQEKIKILKSGFENEIIKISDKLNQGEISFLHSLHFINTIN